ncbi:Minor histocompatibility protein HA-1, partial [Exaiptasia diaphana]
MSSVKGKFPSISIKRKPKAQAGSSSQLSASSTSQSQIFRPLTPEVARRVLPSAETNFNNGQEITNSSLYTKENDCDVLESPSSSSTLSSEAKVVIRSPRPQIRGLNHRESLTSLGHDRSADRSGSVNSESSVYSDLIELPMVDQDDIIALTYHVRAFSEALGALRNTFSEESESPVDSKPPEVKAHERLGEVLSILKGVLNQYEPLHSTDILAAAGTLINKVKSHNYDESDQPPEEFCESIDQLALAFSSSVSDFLMGDQDLQENSRSLEDFPVDDEDDMEEDDGDDMDDEQDDDDYRDDRKGFDKKECPRDISGQKAAELDKTLFGLEHGVDLTLQRTKVWSKYAKDIATYLERRAHLELEFTNKLAKLAQATRASITEDRHLPFQTIYVTSLDQDIEYADNCTRVYSSLLSSKFLEV